MSADSSNKRGLVGRCKAGFTYCKKKASSHKRASILLGIVAVVVLVGGIGGGLWAKEYFDSILPQNAVFQGVPLSGMTQEEVAQTVEEQINPRLQSGSIQLVFQGAPHAVAASEYQCRFNPETVFSMAKKYNFTQEESPLIVPMEYDSQKLTDFLNQLSEQTKVPVTPASHRISGSQLVVEAGKPGCCLEVQAAQTSVVDALQQLQFSDIQAVEQSITDDTIPIQIDQIHQKVYVEVKDASYSISDAGVLSYSEAVQGVNFNLEQAKELVTDPTQGSYTIPLQITPPQVTATMLRQQHDSSACPDALGTFTTQFSPSDTGRNFNIARAASLIQGTVLYPGEAFSFHRMVGNTGKAQGYKESTVYSAQGLDRGYGGGVCQVSSTIYVAALYANMNITERHNHSYTVTYVSPGMDATVSDGGPDLKFKNNRKNPIRLTTSVTSNSITISLYGIQTAEEDYKVTLEPQTVQRTPQTTQQRNTAELPAGVTRVVTNGQPGCKANLVITVSLGGKVISSQTISSTYRAIPKIVEVGTA